MIKKTPILLALAILTAGCAEQIEPAEPSASGDVSTTMAKVRDFDYWIQYNY